MPPDDDTVFSKDAETEFRRRMTKRLREQGLNGSALQARLESLLHSGVNLSLNVSAIRKETGRAPRMG